MNTCRALLFFPHLIIPWLQNSVSSDSDAYGTELDSELMTTAAHSCGGWPRTYAFSLHSQNITCNLFCRFTVYFTVT